MVAINIRHAQIGDDHFVRLVFQRGGAEQFHPLLSAGGNHHPMIEVRETIIQAFPDLRVVINAKDVKGTFLFGLRRGAPVGSTVDLDCAVVALRHVMQGRRVHLKNGWVVNASWHAAGAAETVMAGLPAANRPPTKNHIHDFFTIFSCLIPKLRIRSSNYLACQTVQVI